MFNLKILKTMPIRFVWVFGFVGLVSACLKKEQYSQIPEIQQVYVLRDVENNKDYIYVDFTDGNGDFGLNDSDKNPPFDEGSAFYYNLFLHYQVYEEQGWIDLEELPGNVLKNPFHIRVPRLDNNPTKATVRAEFPFAFYYRPYPNMRFRVYLYDRALNKSNEVISAEIKIPQ